MAKYLVIVESPAKVSTIKKFLGSSYEVMASNGHVRDLPKSSMGIDVENDYEPHYITIRGKGELLSGLRKAAKKADKIYLATDPDREGEAISWHLMYALKLDEEKAYRITFNEITKNAVKESLKHARSIDMDRVNAQQARRCLDRMVGYKISPLLWAKVKGGLSAGRVQSAALRIICDKEAQIEAVVPQEYWSLEADVKLPGEKKAVTASYYGDETGKVELKSQEQIKKIEEELASEKYFIRSVKKSEHIRKAPLPFTTSTLQQEASKTLNFSTQKTMRLAQQLYEGVAMKGQGTVALITYLRTDSTRISQEALAAANAYVTRTYGGEYVGKLRDDPSKKQNVQDAHEAIRPTEVSRTPLEVKDLLPRDLFRLYQLIWRRFMAAAMKESEYETTTVK
ncbi:MAG: type I DNA topoisomerase, partial [Lachnospiraceae bacterium]|nr:type I DNA topoisomerase [Lachnospiraceae bacterium]